MCTTLWWPWRRRQCSCVVILRGTSIISYLFSRGPWKQRADSQDFFWLVSINLLGVDQTLYVTLISVWPLINYCLSIYPNIKEFISLVFIGGGGGGLQDNLRNCWAQLTLTRVLTNSPMDNFRKMSGYQCTSGSSCSTTVQLKLWWILISSAPFILPDTLTPVDLFELVFMCFWILTRTRSQ